MHLNKRILTKYLNLSEWQFFFYLFINFATESNVAISKRDERCRKLGNRHAYMQMHPKT